MPASVESLESVCSSGSSEASYESDTEEQNRLMEQQDWEESMEQLRQLVSIVLLPFLGKWLGRRWSYWAYTRYLRLGLGTAFFFGGRSPSSVQSPA